MTTTGRDDPVPALLLAATALAGERIPLTVLARVLGLTPAYSLAAVDRAVRDGALVAAWDAGEAWFADEAVRREAERALTPADRADLHRRLAEAWAEEPGPDRGEVSRHLSAAVAASVDPVDRARLQIRLAVRAARDGDLGAARAAARAGVAAARRSGSSSLLADAASALEPVGDPVWDGDVHQWCTEALAAPDLDESTRVRLLSRRTQAAVYSGRWADALDASADALRRAEALRESDLLVEALTARQLATSGPDDVEELGRLAGRLVDLGTTTGRPELEMRGRLWRIDALWFAGDLASIEAETTRLASCVERVGGPYARWHLLVTRSALSLARADFERARVLHREALELFDRIGHPATHGASVSFRMWLGHHQGHAEDFLDPSAWEFGTDARWGLFGHLGRAFALVDSGRTDEAAAVYQRCGAPPTWALPRMGLLLVWAIAARVAVGVGADEDVRFLRDRLAPHRGRFVVGGAGATHFLGPVELSLGACSSALGDWGHALEDLGRAGTLCREIGAPGLRVEADCLLAEALHGSGDPAAARAVAGAAAPLARTLGMRPWLRRLERLTAADDPLSPRERQIAGLVADGLSNREIAARLVVSERTAQNHVQHILGKLGFANRAQIAAWVERTRAR